VKILQYLRGIGTTCVHSALQTPSQKLVLETKGGYWCWK